MDVKSISRNSLFERTGQIIYGDRFIGRNYEINEIRKFVVDNRANVAIVGMPRIGKSSLAWQALMSCKETLVRDHKLIPVYIDVSTINTKGLFFSRMVSKVVREISKIYQENQDKEWKSNLEHLNDMSRRIENDDLASLNNDFYDFFEDFFQLTSYQIVYILDEFDKAQNLFDASDFLLLRETAYIPETNLSYVTISRKSIKEIETKDKQNLSNFHGTFNKYIHLNVFSCEDMVSYWKRLEPQLTFTNIEKENIVYIAGHHPLFLDLCCLQTVSTPNAPIIESANLREKLYDEFDQIIDMLDEKGLLSTTKQVVIGPPQSIDKQKIDKLLDFGFLNVVKASKKASLLSITCGDPDEDSYILFSDYFTQLFYFKFFLDIDYWPQWNTTENKLREIVEIFLEERYGKNWANIIEQENISDPDWMDRWKILMERFVKNKRIYFQSTISSPVIVAETGEIYYQFIKKYWNVWFSQIFTPIKNNELVFSNSTISISNRSWEEIFGFLMKVRRPFAHTNTYILSKEDEIVAKGYCDLVLKKIAKWEESGIRPQKIASQNTFLVGTINLDKNRILTSSSPAYIIDREKGFLSGYSPDIYSYSNGEKVKFELYETINPRTGQPFCFAVNVRPYNA
jgi:hypothetical protein